MASKEVEKESVIVHSPLQSFIIRRSCFSQFSIERAPPCVAKPLYEVQRAYDLDKRTPESASWTLSLKRKLSCAFRLPKVDLGAPPSPGGRLLEVLLIDLKRAVDSVAELEVLHLTVTVGQPAVAPNSDVLLGRHKC